MRLLIGMVLAGAFVAASGDALRAQPAQTPPAAPAPVEAPGPAQTNAPPQDAPAPDDRRFGGQASEVIRFGRDYVLPAGETARDVVIVGGSATIAGRAQDVVVVFGSLRVAGTGRIDGDAVVVAGGGSIEPGAVVDGDLVVVGGGLDSPADFEPGGEHVVIGSPMIGDSLQAVVPWVTRGLFWGRPLVPSVPWVWGIAILALFLYVLVAAIFPSPVGATTRVLTATPLTAFLAGLGTLVAIGPVVTLLAISVIGLAVIPFAACGLFVVGLIGRVGAVRWVGSRLLEEGDVDSRGQALRSIVVGSVLLSLLYMVPIVGMVTWASLGVLGLGAATLACIAALRTESPPRPAPPPPSAPPPLEPEATSAGFSASPAPPTTAHALGAQPPAVDLTLMPRATFLTRMGALVLDGLLVLMTIGVFGLDDHSGPPRMFLLVLAYHIGFWAWKGTTIGGIICRQRLVRTDGRDLRFVDALVRSLSGIFSFAVLGLGFLWILRDPESQAWHDRIAGTYVVKVPNNYPLP